MTTPISTTEIIISIQNLDQEARNLLSNLSEAQWMAEAIPGKWSIAEQMGHLLISGYSIVGVLKQDDAFFAKFGSTNAATRSYSKLLEKYNKVLAEPLVAPQRYTPNKSECLIQEEALDAWSALIAKTTQRINNLWDDQRLDKCEMIHPAMERMNAKELLYFKHFHTLHHFKSIQGLINALGDKN